MGRKDEAEASMQYNVTSRPVRSTAGNRYAKLLQGELEKQKDDFYQETYGGFNEEEDDNDFDGAGLEDDDVLDSDFNTSCEGEGDDEGGGSDPDVDPDRKKRKIKRVVTRAYKEPKSLKTGEAPKPRVKREIDPTTTSEKIKLRRSTTEKRNALLQDLKDETCGTEAAKRSKRKIQQMTQEERLLEAEKMEVINKESLEKFLKLEEEKKKKREPKKADKGPQIRFKSYLSYDGVAGDEIDNDLSREAELTRGERATKVSRNLIVFPDSKTFEQTFRLTTSSPLIGTSLERSTAFSTNAADEEKSSSSKVLNKSETKKRLICPITRQPARYFDPLTQQPYSSMSAFKVLRQIYKLKLSILHSTDQISDG